MTYTTARAKQMINVVPKPEKNPKIKRNMAGMLRTENTNPKLKLPMSCSPHVSFSSLVDSFNEVIGPYLSITMIGITKKLTTVQTNPRIPATNWPAFSDRSSIIRNMNPTVAETNAQPTINSKRAHDARNPSMRFGLPPPIRINAHAMIAELKNVITR